MSMPMDWKAEVYNREIDVLLGQAKPLYHNLSVAALVEHAVLNGEAQLASNGALIARTGQYTGRSPKDKFIVRHPEYEAEIHWGAINQPMAPEVFDRLLLRVSAYLVNRPLYVQDCFAGADPRYRIGVRVITEMAWHNLFAKQLFIRPSREELAQFRANFVVLHAPNFKTEPAIDGTRSEVVIAIDFKRRIVLIAGTGYAGEIKKSIFTVMNFILPTQGVFPMHCAANMGAAGDVALFFGLSGTGKTSLSADPERRLIGDDEHGWSDTGVFNFEGGCYAKCINLSREHEPQIWNAIRFGSVVENVVVDPYTREPNYADASITENTRAAYPVEYIEGAVLPSIGGHPQHLFFLAADAFGVLPPISRLTISQAMDMFLLGYTAKVAGTERGITTPEMTFSACFGAPFLPMSPVRYGEMLAAKLSQHQAQAWLVNTGWTGGAYGVGHRIPIRYTRAMIRAALSGALDRVAYRTDPIFGLEVPVSVPDVPDELLTPRNTWQDKMAYEAQARQLVEKMQERLKTLRS
ncbi:MAG: phosphoenolpyruvate carboxykinase (ATP) [Fimbriimonadales bacterium]|nr:phosphoenolpyruvate carboxykinase (ATP) [Fimbriimonadales bacterium]MDW8050981.1 phosphoenolpyruvate carboxykinase (ATP) [Armatimonadota bacterium]